VRYGWFLGLIRTRRVRLRGMAGNLTN